MSNKGLTKVLFNSTQFFFFLPKHCLFYVCHPHANAVLGHRPLGKLLPGQICSETLAALT